MLNTFRRIARSVISVVENVKCAASTVTKSVSKTIAIHVDKVCFQ